MNEQTDYNSKISEAVSEALSEKKTEWESAGKLKRELSRLLREIRARYGRAMTQTHQEPKDIWLCDNYYVLEKEGKQAIRELGRLAAHPDSSGTGKLCAAVDIALCQIKAPVSDQTMEVLLTELSRHMPLGEESFGLLPTAVRLALIRLAWRGCIGNGGEKDIAYSITGFVKFAVVDMDALIAGCSAVERILNGDPAGVYSNMCEESRRHYRYLVAKIAKASKVEEAEAAEKALAEATASGEGPKRHVGYWILRHRALTAPRERRAQWSLTCQIALPLICSIGVALWTEWFWAAFLCFLPFWEIFRTLIWQYSLAGLDIDYLPRMDLKKLKDKPKTVVLVSTLLPKSGDAPQLSRRLEQLYFSNSDPDMYYCVLADFGECGFPADEQDESRIQASRKVVEELNALHDARFMLFLRGRVYNKTQRRYSGWERKRGAITEFIRHIKGEKTSVQVFVGDERALSGIQFIIALDADTNLLYESAQALVSVAMHPLNRPVVNEKGIVTEGYGILCPKISTDLQSAGATAFSRVMSGSGGVTAYETKDKDYYQDLFGESIFAGKGLIDVESFYAVLDRRFPDNQILSHDILEGAYLRAGFACDVEMSDTAPTNMLSWLSRLHRWLRGDWQNILFLARHYRTERGGKIYDNPINGISKFKLFDNLRRSLNCVAALACLIGSALVREPGLVRLLAVTGILAVAFPSFWAALNALAAGGMSSVSRKFFTRTLPHAVELVAQGLVHLIMLPAQAFLTMDAAVRSLWRTFISRKKMLEWTTAAQSDSSRVALRAVFRRFWLPELFGLCFLLLSGSALLVAAGILFALLVPIALFTAKPTGDDSHGLSDQDRDTLVSYNAAMWRYYEDFADKANHYLPPDNMQQSPVYRVANRTSPTNIGLMMLSTLAARDLGLIDTGGLYRRIDRTLSTVERLKTWNGNLYNWYDTLTLDTLKPEYVSCVDSGNFICCLVALKEGLREFVPKLSSFEGLISRIEALIEDCDLAAFYNPKKHLFSIGYEPETEALSGSHYDFFMSEARLASYYAVARKVVGKKHWGSLARTMSRSGSYAGPVSWTGTMFEYFMPHLLLPIYEGSLLNEALTYCLYCQKKRGRQQGIPWGISESAFYAFDNNLNYQYKAFGVQKLGVKRGQDQELVISPYSTFITIPMNPNSSMGNLRNLRELGVYGRYGFYEAVDFTARRVGKDSLAVIRSYMAHHIGMSMVASANALRDNVMQKRFMGDNYMKSAKEFLQEKIAKSTIVYDDLGGEGERPEREDRSRAREASGCILPQAPRAMLLSNGEMTDILTDTGAGWLKFGNIDLTRRSADLLRRPQGFVAVAKASGTLLPATLLPFNDREAVYRVEQEDQAVVYIAEKNGLETSMSCLIHPTISCEQRYYQVKNNSGRRETVDVLFYMEPVLCGFSDYNAHPAYSKLFVTADYDEQSETLVFKRRNRDATENTFLAVGFLEDVEYTFETRREYLMEPVDGIQGILSRCGEALPCADGGVPDACMAISFRAMVPPGAKLGVTLLICAARSRSEGIGGIISMRNLGLLESRGAARSPVRMDSLEGRLGGVLLSQVLFASSERENENDRRANRLGQSGLWHTGISGDLPIALVERPRELAEPVLHSYIRLHGIFRSFNVEFDLVVFCDGEEEIEKLRLLVEKNGGGLVLGRKGGVYLLNRRHLASEAITLIRACARHFAIKQNPGQEQGTAPFNPIKLLPTSPGPMPEEPEHSVTGGMFTDGRFYVNRDSGAGSPLPWSHILANSEFGTLLSDRALGFTWAVNSRENKLTPWYNDICSDNTGEMCILKIGEEFYDLINGSRASFSSGSACYEGTAAGLESGICVTISRGAAKYIDLTLRNAGIKDREILCAYYIEPVLGVTRETAMHICPEVDENGILILRNAFNTAADCYCALTAEPENLSKTQVGFTTDRAAFLSGNWHTGHIAPESDPCGAVIVPITILSRQERKIRFILAYGPTAAEAAKATGAESGLESQERNRYQIHTPDENLNQFINHFAPHQILASRIFGRCAFYQCGGAFGFRDQLQDVMAYILIDPALTRSHILRCCAVQFEEGDVLHWWHDLPENAGGLRGVRTKFSDDLLWLPLAVAEYVEKTGDSGILEAEESYLTAEILPEREHERYISPGRSHIRESVLSHCKKALERGYNPGENGLPLIGCGDWNDGFSSVGLEGKGTSVWLALFLSLVMNKFADLCENYGDKAYAALCLERAAKLLEAVDTHCWDGQWYVRAFFDDGLPMGAAGNQECAIDLLPQSFAALAGMPDRERVASGLSHAWERLVDQELEIVKLFDRPFQHSKQNPGYVKAYPPGIRENGGQYTHAAVWFGLALLDQGDTDRAWKVLNMLNPVYRASKPEIASHYKLEPYYMAADIYSNPSAPGHGGWSMYTGAASWYYRVVLENLFGLTLRGDKAYFSPKLPSAWEKAGLSAFIRDTALTVSILRGDKPGLLCDGVSAGAIPLDGKKHSVVVVIDFVPPAD